MNQGVDTIHWMTPGGMYIPENENLHEGEACLLALRGGRSQLVQLLAFDPQAPIMSFRTRQRAEPVDLSYSYVQWMRLLTPVHLLHATQHAPYSEAEWRMLKKPVEIRFTSGDTLTGEAAALVQNEFGWFFFLVKQTAEVYRYFIPHRGVQQLTLDGEVQQRFDLPTPLQQQDMKNPRLAALLREQPHRYPYALETLYPRVMERIMSLWDAPERLRELFTELMVDQRGGRQGFPAQAALDIFRLAETYDEYCNQPAPETDPWASETARDDLELKGLAFSPTDFHKQVERNNLEAASLYLKAGMPVDTPGEGGWTPLMVASFNGNEDIAELLLNNGANAFYTDNTGYMPLHWAAFNGFKRVSQILIARRVPVNAVNRYGWTPLQQAAARGHVEVCQQLIRAGAKVASADHEGWTPLHKAVVNGHAAIVDLLLEHGGDVRAMHQSGATPVTLAREKHLDAILARLLQAQGSAPAQTQDGALIFAATELQPSPAGLRR